MKNSRKSRLQAALEQEKILWKYLAMTGTGSTETAISRLVIRNQLPQEALFWPSDSALCAYASAIQSKHWCSLCPWVQLRDETCSLTLSAWQLSSTRKQKKHYASEYYKILKTLGESK